MMSLVSFRCKVCGADSPTIVCERCTFVGITAPLLAWRARKLLAELTTIAVRFAEHGLPVPATVTP